jgi:GTPase SAR1 family protein
MGKTSLVKALMSTSSMSSPIAADDRTVGIDRYDLLLEAPSIADHNQIAAQQSLIYEGERDYDGCFTGFGVLRYPNGSTYSGEWDRGMRHGKGVSRAAADGQSRDYSWKAGDVYDGYWNCDVRHGECEYTWFNGDKLKCRWDHGVCLEWTAKNRQVLLSYAKARSIDVQVWDLAGQDVYMLSHSVHYCHRCIYVQVWKPGESLESTMQRIYQWLESLCMHVPDAHIVLVATHCKTNITDSEFAQMSQAVQAAAASKISELNSYTHLEVQNLRKLFESAGHTKLHLIDKYFEHMNSKSEYSQADSLISSASNPGTSDEELWRARSLADGSDFPRSLRIRAEAVCQAISHSNALRARLQLLLGIRDGSEPDTRNSSSMTLHCFGVDSVQGYGIDALKTWLHGYCLSLPFVGQMIPQSWTLLANLFDCFGEDVLSQNAAVALVRQHLPQLKILASLNDAAMWRIIQFWSDVGRIFVYESQVVRDPQTLIALLKPLLHHSPLQMMINSFYRGFISPDSLTDSESRTQLECHLRNLLISDEFSLSLLDHLSAWKPLQPDQRMSMISFFQRSRMMYRVDSRRNAYVVTSRLRSKPPLAQQIEHLTKLSTYHVFYMITLKHVGIIAYLQSTIAVSRLQFVNLHMECGLNSLVIRRTDNVSCFCVFSVEDYSATTSTGHRFAGVSEYLGEPFSSVLRIATSDFGMLKFASACCDAAMQSGNFGTRFQCWITTSRAIETGIAPCGEFLKWTQFCDSHSSLLSKHSLSKALRCNHHEHVTSGESIKSLFQPRSSIFISHAWGDGTGEFIARLRSHIEEQTLASVWVDQEGLNQLQETIIPSFRDALCQARVFIVVLTPTYLTRPNCLRELRWALDFEEKGYLRVLPLELHPAVLFRERERLLRDGCTQGLVFSSKEKKVKRLCPEANALIKRLNDIHMNALPWHALQAWRSDEEKDDWKECRMFDDGLGLQSSVASVALAALVGNVVDVIKGSLASLGQHSSSECVALDDTQALLAGDIDKDSLAICVLDASTYPEACARELKIELEEKIKNKKLSKRRRDEERLRATEEAKTKKCVAFVCSYFFEI